MSKNAVMRYGYWDEYDAGVTTGRNDIDVRGRGTGRGSVIASWV